MHSDQTNSGPAPWITSFRTTAAAQLQPGHSWPFLNFVPRLFIMSWLVSRAKAAVRVDCTRHFTQTRHWSGTIQNMFAYIWSFLLFLTLFKFHLKVCSIFHVATFLGKVFSLLFFLSSKKAWAQSRCCCGPVKPIETLNRISGYTNKLDVTWLDRLKPQKYDFSLCRCPVHACITNADK